MKVIIDRFEDEFAVVELPDRRMANISKILLPEAREGDVITIKIGKTDTLQRKQTIERLAGELWKE